MPVDSECDRIYESIVQHPTPVSHSSTLKSTQTFKVIYLCKSKKRAEEPRIEIEQTCYAGEIKRKGPKEK